MINCESYPSSLKKFVSYLATYNGKVPLLSIAIRCRNTRAQASLIFFFGPHHHCKGAKLGGRRERMVYVCDTQKRAGIYIYVHAHFRVSFLLRGVYNKLWISEWHVVIWGKDPVWN